ncbi:ABC transporter substrate-binding protein [Azospirillum sp. TSO22-1]|uniref:ABC transporter substrate-binding protein n=1 Tax=Azospirillum sp. TSO22-1 TaxID=716789 RepID=UPI000D61DBE7|nr:ABC transporter substrate-binding protein [Azospirillum sp. TSO22-1]PWC44940.1 ABC transporter substrate-binding protein [Azospirillum sp. TSO22-1]
MTTARFAGRRLLLGALLAAGLFRPAAAHAEATEVRFARNLGLGYLQLYVMQDKGLVEKHARAAGLDDVKASYTAIGNPSTITESLLSGNADFGAAGVPPFIIAWDKTRGNADLRGLAALNAQPAYLNTNRPEIRSLKDFTEKDRIVVPSVRASYQAIVLQMAAEQTFGPGEHARLDPLTVSLAHPDGTAALLSGKTEITAHFTSPPFQDLQLKDPKIHKVLSSYDVLGGAGTFSAIWTSAKFHDANPRLTRAVLAALDEAVGFIRAKPREAAEIYIRLDNSKLDLDTVERLIADPEVRYASEPLGIQKFTDFMARIGSIRNRPARWQELFFADIHDRAGS